MSNQKYISDSLRRKKQKIRKIKMYAYAGLFVIVCIVFIYIARLPAIQIQQVKVSGTIFVEKTEIEKKTQDILRTKSLFFIPKSNIFLFPKKQLEKSILQNPAIISAKIRKDFWNTLTIDITEQDKKMIYCSSVENNTCLYINEEGFIYAQVKDIIIPEQEVLVYTELGEKRIGEIILDKSVYINVLLFIKNTARYDIKIGKVYIKQDGIIEFVTRDDVRIITSVFDDFQKGFSHLIALFEKDVIHKDKFFEIEYIDLRFGNKVFYKNKTN